MRDLLQTDTETELYKNFIDSCELPENLSFKDRKVKVSIIIPVFNKLNYTRQCIFSVLKTVPAIINYEIIVIDNASADGTKEFLNSVSTNLRHLKIISNSKNLGFAKACNQGIKAAEGEFLLLLNNDTIAKPGWLQAMLDEAGIAENVGIVGSRLLYPDGSIQHVWVDFGYHLTFFTAFHPFSKHKMREHPEVFTSRDVLCVTGASMLIKTEVIDKIGMLDEEYINSFEDVDLCVRALIAGYRIRYASKSVLYHFESISENRTAFDDVNFKLFNKKWFEKLSVLFKEFQTDPEKSYFSQFFHLRLPKSGNPLSRMIKRYIAHRLKYKDKTEITSPVKEILNINQPDVSLILFSENCLKYIGAFIESIEATVKGIKFELIVIDNFSKDGSRQFWAEYSNRNLEHDFRLLLNEPQRNEWSQYNQGAELSRSNKLVFIKPDLVLLPEWLDELLRTLVKDETTAIVTSKHIYPDIDKVYGGGVCFGHSAEYSNYLFESSPELRENKESQIFPAVYSSCFVIRKNHFLSMGGVTEVHKNYTDFFDFCLKLLSQGFEIKSCPDSEVIHLGISNVRVDPGLNRFPAENYKSLIKRFHADKKSTEMENDSQNGSSMNAQIVFIDNPAIEKGKEMNSAELPVTFAWFGSLDKNSGVRELLKIISEICSSVPGFKLILADTGNNPKSLDYKKACHKLISNLRPDNTVIFKDTLNTASALTSFLYQTDGFIFNYHQKTNEIIGDLSLALLFKKPLICTFEPPFLPFPDNRIYIAKPEAMFKAVLHVIASERPDKTISL